MIKFKNRIKKIGAGIMASLCAVSLFSTSISGTLSAGAAMATENTAFPTADEVIAEAATLLGSPYGWGCKGYSGIYYQDSYSPLDLNYVRNQGVDCSGLLYYTLTHLGYSTSGFSWNNPVPVDTPHWLSLNDNCTITYNGITSKIDVEKSNIPYTERPYWECADGSTISAGSMVIAQNPYGEDHSWIYMGEFDSRNDVIAYLESIGVNESYISSRTVGDGNGDGGTHWRIESNGSEGCVINNRTDGKSSTALNMSAFRVTQNDVNFTITKVLSTDNSVKISGVSSIDGSKAVYGVYTDKGCTQKVGEITIGADGTGSIKLPNKQYYVKEISAPKGYDLSSDVVALKANSNVNVEEDVTSGKITINKTAEDGVVADREFQISWTDGGKKHTKNAKTNSNGAAVFDGLHVYDFSTKGAINYTVSEVNADPRYILPATQELKLTNNSTDYTVNVKFENVLKKGKIALIKHSDDGTTGIDTPESGAEFEIFLKSAGSFDNAKETERDRLTTDENGFAQTKELPYGTYTVHQVTGWKNTEFIEDFDVIIDENGKTYQYILNDAVISANIKIAKKDAETGKVIPVSGVGFKIWSVDNGEYISQTINYPEETTLDTFYTNDSGNLMLPKELAYGDYELHEVKAPTGYFLDNEPVPFTVDGTEKTITVEKYDTPQKGKISVSKRGEIFKSVTAVDDKYTPVFEESGLSGAEFEVRAAEDIYTVDGTLRASSGDVVADLITDTNGYAVTGELYLGKYTVSEKKAPVGYVLNSEEKLIELTCTGQEVAVSDAVNSSFINDYQGVDICLKKLMEHDEQFGIGDNDEYKNVTFGLFAAEDITAADCTVIPENGLVSTVTLGEDMTAHFEEKLPFARYYIQEIATDESYMLNGEKYLVNFEYMGQEQTTVDIDCGTFDNKLKRGSVSGKKVDEKNEPLEKAVFGLFSSDTKEFTAEKALLTTESDKDGQFGFTDIPYGKYIVKEIAAPTGYILSEKQYDVNISEDGDSVEITAENVPITINKTSPPPTGDTGRSPLGLVMIIVGLCGVFYVSYKYRKMTKEKDTRSDEYSDLCPDFVEGAENE